MKRKINFLLFLALSFSTFLNAQQIDFTWGPTYLKNELVDPETIIRADADGCYLMTKEYHLEYFQTFVWLARFDNNGTQLWEKNITQGNILGKSYDTEGFVFTNTTKMLVFFSLFDPAKKLNVLYVSEINDKGEKSELKEVMSEPAEKMGKRGNYTVVGSPDGSHIVVQFEPERVKDTKEQIKYTVINPDLKVLWSNTFTLSFDWDRAVNNDVMINNEGRIFVVKKRALKGEWLYDALVFEPGGKNMKESPIDLKGKKLASQMYTLSKAGDLLIGGYYSEDGKVIINGITSNGVFFRKINHDGLEISTSFEGKFDKGIQNLNIKNIVEQPSGQVLAFGEVTTTASIPTGLKDKSGFPINKTRYHHGDISVSALNPDGKFAWVQIVKKEQEGDDYARHLCSYYSFAYGEYACLLFTGYELDYMENRPTNPNAELQNSRIPVFIDFDASGKGWDYPQFNCGVGGRKNGLWIRPDAVGMAPDGSIFMPAYSGGREYKMGHITIK